MKKKSSHKMKSVYIPHLNYRIWYGINPEKFDEMDMGFAQKFACSQDKHNAHIYFRKKPKPMEAGSVAHEVFHCLQFLCIAKGIDMARETEHMPYIMQYVVNTIYGIEYVDCEENFIELKP